MQPLSAPGWLGPRPGLAVHSASVPPAPRSRHEPDGHGDVAVSRTWLHTQRGGRRGCSWILCLRNKVVASAGMSVGNEGIGLGAGEPAEAGHGRRMLSSVTTPLGDQGLVAPHPHLHSPSSPPLPILASTPHSCFNSSPTPSLLILTSTPHPHLYSPSSPPLLIFTSAPHPCLHSPPSMSTSHPRLRSPLSPPLPTLASAPHQHLHPHPLLCSPPSPLLPTNTFILILSSAPHPRLCSPPTPSSSSSPPLPTLTSAPHPRLCSPPTTSSSSSPPLPTLASAPRQSCVRPPVRAGLCTGSWALRGLQGSAPGVLRRVLPQTVPAACSDHLHATVPWRGAPTTLEVRNRQTRCPQQDTQPGFAEASRTPLLMSAPWHLHFSSQPQTGEPGARLPSPRAGWTGERKGESQAFR